MCTALCTAGVQALQAHLWQAPPRRCGGDCQPGGGGATRHYLQAQGKQQAMCARCGARVLWLHLKAQGGLEGGALWAAAGAAGGVAIREGTLHCCCAGHWYTSLTLLLTLLLLLLPQAHDELVASLSALQLESVVYACQRHEQLLPDGSRGGFFIGRRPAAPCCCAIPVLCCWQCCNCCWLCACAVLADCTQCCSPHCCPVPRTHACTYPVCRRRRGCGQGAHHCRPDPGELAPWAAQAPVAVCGVRPQDRLTARLE